MSSNKAMIRFYFLLFFLSALLAYIVDLNGQFHFISLNSPWISNAFCFSILSSILAGIVVALVVEIRQYQLHKKHAQNILYTTASELYALISVQKACLTYYIVNNTVSIPNNICDECARQLIITHIHFLPSIDYSPFSSKDSIIISLGVFNGQINNIECSIRDLVDLQIAYNRTMISFLDNGDHQGSVTTSSSLMLNALQEAHDKLNKCLLMLNEFCCSFEKVDSKRFNWACSKKAVDDVSKKIEANPYYRPSGK